MNEQKNKDIQKKKGFSKFNLVKNWIDYFDKKLGSKDRRINKIKKNVYLIGFITTVGIILIFLIGLIPNFNYQDVIIFLIFIIGLILLIQLAGLLFSKNLLTKLLSGIIYLLIFTFLVLLIDPDLFKNYMSMFNFHNKNELKIQGTIYLNKKLQSGVTIIPLISQVPTITNRNGRFDISIPIQESIDTIKFHIMFEALHIDTVISKKIEPNVKTSFLDFNINKGIKPPGTGGSTTIPPIGIQEYILSGRVITQLANRTEPLNGAFVKTIDGSIKDTTDNDGNFKLRIRDKKNSVVNIIFYKSGYNEKKYYYKLPKTDIEVILNKENQ